MFDPMVLIHLGHVVDANMEIGARLQMAHHSLSEKCSAESFTTSLR